MKRRAKRIQERDRLYLRQEDKIDYFLDIGDIKSAEAVVVEQKRLGSKKTYLKRIMAYYQGMSYAEFDTQYRKLLNHYYLIMFH